MFNKSGSMSIKSSMSLKLIVLFMTLILAYLILSPSTFAIGNTYYVAKTGSDSNPGTESQPFLTIQKAANITRAGDTVYVKAGTYDEWVTVSTLGTASSRITFDNYGNDAVKIGRGIKLTGSYITFKDFEITPGNNVPSGNQANVQMEGSNNAIDNLNVHDVALNGIEVAGQNNSALNSDFIRAGKSVSNVAVGISGDNAILKGNYIGYKGYTGNWSSDLRKAIDISDGSDSLVDGAVVEGNVIEGPLPGGGNGIHIPRGLRNSIFKGNIITKIGRLINSGKHTQTFGFYSRARNITFDGNIIGSFEPMPSGWEGPFTHFFFANSQAGTYSAENIKFYNNLFLAGDTQGIRTKTGELGFNGMYFYNNILYEFTGGGGGVNYFSKNNTMINGGSIGGQKDYNMYVGSAVPSGEGSHSFSTNISLANLFFNPNISSATNYGINADWHLKAGSPAINAGVQDAYAYPTDRDGKSRLGAPDIGAYEDQGGDTTSPTISAFNPADGAILSGTATLSASATDNVGVSKVEFYIDNVLKGTDTSSPYSYALDTTAYSNGLHTLMAKAYDAAGNSSSFSRTVTVNNSDTTAPTISVFSPADGTVLSGIATLSASATDNIGVSKVEFYVDSALKETDTSSPYSYALDTTAYSNGSHALMAKAYDAAGNSSSLSRTVVVSNSETSGLVTGSQVTAYSHQFDSRGYVSYLLDGKKQFNTNYTGWWVKNPTGTEYATIQFNNIYNINKINHYNDGQYGSKSVTVKYSLDNVNWTLLGTYSGLNVTANTVNNDTFTFAPVQAKYLRFEYNTFNDSEWFQISEIEISYTNIDTITTGSRVIAYSHQFDSRGYASYLVDEKKQFNTNYTGWWVKSPAGTEYAAIQLSDAYYIDRINHYNDGQYGGRTVTIRYSLDNINWTLLGTYSGLNVTANTVNKDTFTFAPVQAKYLRFEYNTFNDSEWFQISEIEVFL